MRRSPRAGRERKPGIGISGGQPLSLDDLGSLTQVVEVIEVVEIAGIKMSKSATPENISTRRATLSPRL